MLENVSSICDFPWLAWCPSGKEAVLAHNDTVADNSHRVNCLIVASLGSFVHCSLDICLPFVLLPFPITLFPSSHSGTSEKKRHDGRRSVWTFKRPPKLSETDLRRSDLAARSSDSTSSIGGSMSRRCQLVRRRINSLCVGFSICAWSKCRHTRCRIRGLSIRAPTRSRISRA